MHRSYAHVEPLNSGHGTSSIERLTIFCFLSSSPTLWQQLHNDSTSQFQIILRTRRLVIAKWKLPKRSLRSSSTLPAQANLLQQRILARSNKSGDQLIPLSLPTNDRSLHERSSDYPFPRMYLLSEVTENMLTFSRALSFPPKYLSKTAVCLSFCTMTAKPPRMWNTEALHNSRY